jgi:type IV pilus assembly protein PilC
MMLGAMGIKLSDVKKAKNTKVNRNILYEILNHDIQFKRNRLSDKRKEKFYSELSILLAAKVDINSALQIITDQYENTRLALIYTNIKDSIIKGQSLSHSLRDSKYFSEYEWRSIHIGEESGKLELVLLELVSFYSGRVKQRRQLINVISYPAIVSVTAIGAVLFMLRFVVPMFSDIFKRFNAELPALTNFILNISNIVASAWLPFVLIITAIFILLYYNRKKTWFRKISSSLILRIPVLNEIIKSMYLYRFCQSMGLLLSSEVPMENSLLMVSKMISFYPLEESIKVVRKDVMEGDSLHSSLGKHKIFNKKMIALVRVSEEVKQLDKMFNKLSVQFNDEAEYKVSVINNLLEPIIIITLGAFVALILIAMYLPLFRLSTTFGL